MSHDRVRVAGKSVAPKKPIRLRVRETWDHLIAQNHVSQQAVMKESANLGTLNWLPDIPSDIDAMHFSR
jgi:hypothetical protein